MGILNMIRPAKKSDIPKINDLLGQVLTVHHNGRPDIFKPGCRKYTDEQILEIISSEDTPVFVYENCEGEILGYCFSIIKVTRGDNILADMKTLYIDDLCVDEGARGIGVGKALYEYTLNYAKVIGCYNLTLNVWECNPTAKRFYEKMGLIPQKTVMEKLI